MSLPPRPEIKDIAPCQHGSIDYGELETLGIAPQDILDFSANLNPFGAPPDVVKAICKGASGLSEILSRYPDSEARQLRRALAQKLRVDASNVIIGSGSTELIRLAALAYFRWGDKVLIIEPTYGEYELACRISGASVIKQTLSSDNGFQPNVPETIDLIRQHHPKGIFICNPNNPTGRYISRGEFEMLVNTADNCLIVLDEAYVSFVDNPWCSLDLITKCDLLILRSMTKDYALAGLRLGYGIAKEEIIATLRRVCPPWNVNCLAQKAGMIAITKDDHLERCRTELKKAKDYLIAELTSLGLPPFPSEANFFLVEVGDATSFRRELLKQKILVRDCSSFGLPQFIRIAPRTLSECHVLVDAIKELRKEHYGRFVVPGCRADRPLE